MILPDVSSSHFQLLFGVNQEALSLIPDRQEIFNQLNIWVVSTYESTPKTGLAKKYLDKCIKRMNEQGLRGSTQALINYNKSQIEHALERDELSQKIAILSFEQSTLEKIETCKHKLTIHRQEQEESALENSVKQLQWENHVMEAVRLQRSKKIEASVYKSPVQTQTDHKIARGEEIIELLQREHVALTRDIINEENKIQSRKKEIVLLEKKVSATYAQMVIKEKEFQACHAACLKKMEDIQKKIEQEKEKICRERARLDEGIEIIYSQFYRKVNEFSSKFKFNSRDESRVKELEEYWEAKAKSEVDNFQSRKHRTVDRYNRLKEEFDQEFNLRRNSIQKRFHSEVILNRKNFTARWDDNTFITPPVDINPVLEEIAQERKKKMQSLNTEKSKVIEENLRQARELNVRHESELNRVSNKYRFQILQDKIFLKSKEALEKKISEKLKHLARGDK